MNPILVCSYNEDLIRSIQGYDWVIQSVNLSDFKKIDRNVSNNNRLHCIWFKLDSSLGSLNFPSDICPIPSCIELNSIGPLYEAMPNIKIIRKLPIRLFLPSERSQSYTETRILSSLGVHCGIKLSGDILWDQLDDLMHYSVYAKAGHASIEPFEYILKNYDPRTWTDIGSTIFENPCRYLYVSSEGKIAINQKNLQDGKFLGHLQDLEKILKSPEYMQITNPYGDSFINFDQCSSCSSWRICLGKFAKNIPDACGFFSNLLEAAQILRERRNHTVPMWSA